MIFPLVSNLSFVQEIEIRGYESAWAIKSNTLCDSSHVTSLCFLLKEAVSSGLDELQIQTITHSNNTEPMPFLFFIMAVLQLTTVWVMQTTDIVFKRVISFLYFMTV